MRWRLGGRWWWGTWGAESRWDDTPFLESGLSKTLADRNRDSFSDSLDRDSPSLDSPPSRLPTPSVVGVGVVVGLPLPLPKRSLLNDGSAANVPRRWDISPCDSGGLDDSDADAIVDDDADDGDDEEDRDGREGSDGE